MKPQILLLLFFILGSQGCSMFRSANDSELVFPKTDVGTPTGSPVSQTIGADGGTITSSDGKLTLMVPKGTVKGNTQFSIQPISNMAPDGLGAGYRLGPSDQKFTLPIDLTMRFDDADLEGTIPEGLQLAYQEKDGTWHAQATKVDEKAHTISVYTTHFSDWLYLRTIGVTPTKATVLVGDAIPIKVDSCSERNAVYNYNPFKFLFNNECTRVSNSAANWSLIGPGKLTKADKRSQIVYTAPAVKPSDPYARVIVDIDITTRDPDTGEVRTYPRKFETKIKIIDRGYQATGNTGDAQYSGVVCLDSTFTINADVKIINFALDFTPGSDTGGTWKMAGSMPYLKGSGSGSYTFEDGTSEHPPRLHLIGSSTGTIPVGSITKAADTYIGLIPNDGNECIPKGK